MPPPPHLRLAILDDYTSLSHSHFSTVLPPSSITSFPQTLLASPSSLSAQITRLEPFTIISSMRERTPFPAELLSHLPNLRLLLTTGTRNASIDLAAATAAGIVVAGAKGTARDSSTVRTSVQPSAQTSAPTSAQTSAPSAEGPAIPPPAFTSINQHAWALLLAVCSRLAADARDLRVRGDGWQTGMMVSLGGRTIGLLGLGRLGAQMARTAIRGFGMRVVAWSPNLTEARAEGVGREVGLDWDGILGGRERIEVVGSKRELFERADVVSLHLVLAEGTRGIVGRDELGAMKGDAILINTARAGLVDEGALVEVLEKGKIGGVGLDVYWEEPLGKDSRWRRAEEWAKAEVVLSPHMGYVNAGTMGRWYEEQAENVGRWLEGKEVLNRLN